MTCTVCGQIIESEARYIQAPDKDTLCTGASCHMAYMLEHITMGEIAECFAGSDWMAELERARQGGLQGLTTEDKAYLLEWYMSGEFYECDNDEWDEDTGAYEAADLEHDSRREAQVMSATYTQPFRETA